jgi:threonine dehydrogenase-like Zn-dependent dehydrogenase
MKYVGAKNGEVFTFNKEIPQVKENYVLIKTKYSAISPGTENTMLVNSKDEIVALGYCAAGVVESIGENVSEFIVGEKVACYGAPYVYHSEYLLVPKTMCVKVPENLDLKEASLGGIGAIAIHALRKANLQFGEVAVVVGLGIFGQILGQVAVNAGYQVLPLNRSTPRAELFENVTGVKSFCDEKELEKEIARKTNGRGADAVFLCTGGDSNYLTNKSLEWLRDKGKSVIVGDLQPNYQRELMFAKEIEILISRAGGPGRYDESFEKNAVDYPYGQVRWTETRNVAEFIRLLNEKRIEISNYPIKTVNFENISETYRKLHSKGNTVLTNIFDYEA